MTCEVNNAFVAIYYFANLRRSEPTRQETKQNNTKNKNEEEADLKFHIQGKLDTLDSINGNIFAV